jgi:hypothetical protein
VPLEPWSRLDEVGPACLDRRPADLWPPGADDLPAKCGRERLAAKADAKHGYARVVRTAQEVQLVADPRADAVMVIHRPGSAHGDDGIKGERVGESDRDSWLMEVLLRHHYELLHVEAVVGKRFPYRSGR